MKKILLYSLLAITAFSVAACSKSTDPVASATSAYNVVPMSTYKGHSWGDWSNAWWSWALSMPAGANAVEGTAPMETNQSGDVWFLCGKLTSGTATRSITITHDKSLFFPLINLYGDTTGGAPPATQLDGLLQGMWSSSAPRTESAEIDGHSVANVSTAYFAPVTDFVNQNIPANNILGDVTYGNAKVNSFAASCGDYLMIDGLSIGTHTIHFKGSTSNGLSIDMTYTVTVQ